MATGGFLPLLGSVLLFIVLGALTGLVSRSRVSALRYWSLHPWRFFWLSNALSLLLAFLALTLKLAVPIAPVLFVPLALLLITSAIQGLRVSWLHSRRRAAVIILVAFGILIIPQLTSTPVVTLIITSIVAVLLWIFSAWIAKTVGKLKIVRRKKVRKVLKKSIKEAQKKINKFFAKKNIKRAYILVACLILLAGIGLYFASKIMETQNVQKSFWGLTLDSTREDIKFLKGAPTKEEKDDWHYESTYKEGRYYFYNYNYDIIFEDDKIRMIATSDVDKQGGIQGINYGDSYEKVIKKFGNPSNISRSTDELTRIFSYEKYNVFFMLEQGRVCLFGIYNPSFGPIQVK